MVRIARITTFRGRIGLPILTGAPVEGMPSAVSDEVRHLDADASAELSSAASSGAVSSGAEAPTIVRRASPLTNIARKTFFGDDRGRSIAHSVLGGLVLLGGVLIVAGPRRTSVDEGTGAAPAVAPQVASAMPVQPYDAPATPEGNQEPAKPHVPAWRVASLRDDPSIEVFEGSLGKRTLSVALRGAGFARADVLELYRAFEGVHRLDRRRPGAAEESFVVAKDRAKGTLVAFEHVVSPFEIWQARREDVATSTRRPLVARRLDLAVEHRRVTAAFALSSDLAKAIQDAGLRAEVAENIDDALEGHIELAALKAGVRLRIVATEDWVEGAFARYHVDAVEFVPPSGASQRVYAYERETRGEKGRARARLSGYFDAKGQQPYRGTFRSPLPFTRVTSRFNPKRMHPVLHVVKPHNGVDFGASTGTSVFAASTGTVSSVGNGGRCGNMVQIAHANGLVTAYCHLSKFAAGLRAGQHVEARQLIGYVGQTGSATGPHLHFAVKRGGNFIDPLSLKIDGVRVLPPQDRPEFAKQRAELDIALDGIVMPNAVDSADDKDTDNDKDDGDNDE